MKICHITSAHKSNDVRIFHKECVSLANIGYDVYLVAQGESLNNKGIEIIGIGQQPQNRLIRMTIFSKRICNIAFKLDADVYHLHDPELLLHTKQFIKRNKRVIFDSHEDISEQIKGKTWIPVFFRNLVSKLYSNYQAKILEKLDAVISVSPNICDKLRKYNENTIMVSNYPILIDSEFNKRDRRISKTHTLCFAGGVTRQWSHEFILQSIQNISSIEYKVFGHITSEYQDKLVLLDKNKKLKYMGIIDHCKVFSELSNAICGLAICQYSDNMSGKLGSLGNTKIFEYMLASIPIICTDFELWKEIVEKNNCGICVNPQNIEEIKSAINYILNHPEEAKKMGENGYKTVVSNYSWQAEEKKLLDLYNHII